MPDKPAARAYGKKPWQTPTLTVFGTIPDLTAGTPGLLQLDVASVPPG
jgi:hypothetical protein